MEDIQSYTDKLRKTYRQSFDVILPFTNHETVVYCNDEEFENYLKEQHTMKDLQACIYLLERHIDLQKEIIQGLTNLQEIHKYDKLSSEYNNVSEKLILAQDKLALLRSRTIRCLTKQIQQRCGDSNTELPPYSSKKDERTTPTEPNPPLTNGDTNGDTLPQEQESYDISNNIVPGDTLISQNEATMFSSEKVFEEIDRIEETNGIPEKPSPNLDANHEKLSGKTDSGISVGSDSSENGDVCKVGLENKQPNKHIVSDKSSMDQNKNLNFRQVEQLSASNVLDEFRKVNDIPDSSRFSSSHSNEMLEKNSSCERQTLEPVDETVVVSELLEINTRGAKDLPRRENGNEECVSREEVVGRDGSVNIKDSAVESCTYQREHITPSDELVSKSNISTMDWDPGLLVREICGKGKKIEPRSQQHDDKNTDDNSEDAEEIHMAGYLEKLPVNKKKTSLLKNWRKRYFKIQNGQLLYFQDHRTASPISFIKLGGSEVFEIGNKCLEVTEREDLGGRLLVIRCASWTEVKDWRKALEHEAKQKVKRKHFEQQTEKKQVIIVDFGSSSIKAGFLEDNAWPQVIIPSVYAVHKENCKDTWYGYEALAPSVRNHSKLVFPLRSNTTVGKFLLDPNQLIGFLEIIFKELQADPSQYQVIMTTPVNLRNQDKERLVEILLDYFQVAGIYMTSQAILSMYSYSATCGIVVNIGDNIDVVPIEDGYIVESGESTSPYGGRHVTDHFVRLLSSSGHRYFSEIENYIGEYLKIKTCYISQNYDNELKNNSDDVLVNVDMSPFNLPNGDQLVTVGKERFRAHEVLFKPELWGKDNPGLTELVYQAVSACSIDSRKDICRNIYLSGATTKIPGIAERLQTELSRKFPSSVIVQVHASADRQFAAFIGAAVMASLDTFHDLCITPQEWEEVGPDALKKWDGV